MLEIQYIATDNLIPYINNSRTHSEAQIHQITASIVEFGFTNPVLIDEKAMIIAGHGRIEAAKILGIDEVPTITLKGLTEAQRKAYVIADNKLALNAGWDFDAIRVELELLQELDFNIDLLGFEEVELDEILNGWSTDIELPDNKEESGLFKITVSGNELDKDDLLSVIEMAIKDSGIEGAKVSA